jgi:endogenous inhibitor of DNA gyrase (YacG/DUF329 family)
MAQAAVCVLCRTRPVDPRWKPFCSERCRNEDLARWVEGTYRVAGDPVPPAGGEADPDAQS